MTDKPAITVPVDQLQALADGFRRDSHLERAEYYKDHRESRLDRAEGLRQAAGRIEDLIVEATLAAQTPEVG